MDIQQFAKSITPATKYYMLAVFITTLILTYSPSPSVAYYLIMDYDPAIFKLQVILIKLTFN